MSKRNKIIYWIATLWATLGMVSTAIVQLIREKSEVESITALGYPVYFLSIIAIWKFLGVLTILVPRFALLKEWAYAGFFFAMTGAAVSRIIVGDAVTKIFPSLLLLILILVSWYFRPSDRRLIPLN